jgi:hypothetical protein
VGFPTTTPLLGLDAEQFLEISEKEEKKESPLKYSEALEKIEHFPKKKKKQFAIL